MQTREGALETEVKAIRGDAAAARVLAGGADRDVSEFHAKLDVHKALIEAMRADVRDTRSDLRDTRTTLQEHGQKIDNLTSRMGGVESRLGGMASRMDSLETGMRGGFAKLAAGQSVITDLLTRHLEVDDPGQN
jgi:chromosome segregation ATPase